MSMKALSAKPPYAAMIAAGSKTIELRTWQTSYRGPLLICASARGGEGVLPEGVALCVVDLVDIKPYENTFRNSHAAGFEADDLIGYEGFAWYLKNIRTIEPVPVKGRLSLYDVDIPIKYTMPMNEDDLLQYWIECGLCHE